MDTPLKLYIGLPTFAGIDLAKSDSGRLVGIVFSWIAETEVANIKWLRLVSLTYMFPFIRHIESFYNTQEAEDGTLRRT